MLALEGIRILDLTRLGPGPFCTMILGDMGAEVIKIEEGDDRGAIGRDLFSRPGASPEEEERNLAKNFLARNKKSIVLNFKTTESKDVFYKLARTADVIYEGYRPGVTKRLGIDYETISKINPRIIYCSLSGYGQDGPYKELPGHDPNYRSIAGLVSVQTDLNDKPMISGVTTGDTSGALHSVIGILCALIARDKTGEGQYIDIAFTDSSLDLGALNLAHYMALGLVPRTKDIQLMQNVWETKDGKYLVTAPVETYFWERFCKALGLEELIPFQYSTGNKNEEVVKAIADKIKTKTRDEWFEILKEANTCVSPVLSFKEVMNNAQLAHRQMFIELDHPTQKKVKQLGFAIKMSKTPAKFRSFAPKLGEHTDDLLKEVGFSEAQIKDLKKAGAVK